MRLDEDRLDIDLPSKPIPDKVYQVRIVASGTIFDQSSNDRTQRFTGLFSAIYEGKR
jgi:hypothetical protein